MMAVPNWLISAEAHASLAGVLGSDFSRHNNLHIIDGSTVAYVVGNAVRIHNVKTGSMRYVLGRDGAGIGAIAVHPEKSHLVVAERGNCPNIQIYSLPDLSVVGVLKDGTERSYSDVNFSASGTRVVSVGGFPDFLLTVWDWAANAVVLRTKAFGQEVFNARFTPDDDSKLTTSGTGHVRFWRMADTFTGLKLQGDIGKFGRVDLSDIHAFAECPDGKVITGSEGGMLLMWDGSLIKTQIGRAPDGQTPESGVPAIGAHDAAIHVVHLDRALGLLVTGGDDGFVRWWDFKSVDRADVLPDGVSIPSLSVAGEASLGKSARVRSLVKLSDVEVQAGTAEEGEDAVAAGTREVTWLVTDGSGSLYRLLTHVSPNGTVSVEGREAVLQGHAGPVTAGACSPVAGEPYAATVGADGSVRCWHTGLQQLMISTKFEHTVGGEAAGARQARKGKGAGLAATCLSWAPLPADASGRTVAVGFSDGTLRVLFRGASGWNRLHVAKPHTAPVAAAAYAPNGRLLATASADGTVFFFNLQPRTGAFAIEAQGAPAEAAPALQYAYTPAGFVTLTLSRVGALANAGVAATALCWSEDSCTLSVGCADGTVRVLAMPESREWPPMPESLDLDGYSDAGAGPVRLAACVSLCLELLKDAPPPPKEEEHKKGEKSGASKGKKGEAEAPEEEVPTEMVVPANPGAITSIVYSAPGRLLLGCSGDGSHMLHELTLPKDKGPAVTISSPTPVKPAASYPAHTLLQGEALHQPHVSCLAVLPGSGDRPAIVVVGTTGGSVFVRSLDNPTAALQLALHDSAAVEGQGAPGLRCVMAAPADPASPPGTALTLFSCGADGGVAVTLIPGTALTALQGALTPNAALPLYLYKPIDIRLAARVGFGSPAALEAATRRTPPVNLPALPSHSTPVQPLASPPTEPTLYDAWLSSPDHAARDIVDPAAYSLQQDRLLSAADGRAEAAEVHKARVRRVIESLRQGFASLRAEAAAAASVHAARGLSEAELVLDEGLDAELRAQGMARLAGVDEAHAYERQKRRVGLSKLVGTLALNELATDKSALCGIVDSGLRVYTLRQAALSSAAEGEIAAATAEATVVCATPLGRTAPPPDKAPVLDPRAGVVSGDLDAAMASKRGVSETTLQAHEEISFEARKAARMERREALKSLKNARPGPNDEHAPDAAAVTWASSHMGDFPLKLAKGYTMPEGLKVDATAKRRQLLVLEGHVHAVRTHFNAKVATARERKRSVLTCVAAAESEVLAIDAELSSSGSVGSLLFHAPGGLASALATLLPPALADPSSPLATFSVAALTTSLPEEESTAFLPLPSLAAKHIADAKAEVALARARAACLARGDTTEEATLHARSAVSSLSTFHAQLEHMVTSLPGMGHASTGPSRTEEGAEEGASSGEAQAAAAGGASMSISLALAECSPDPCATVLSPAAAGVRVSMGLGGFALPADGLTALHYAGGVTLSLPSTVAGRPPSAEALSVALRTCRALLCRKASLRGRQLALVEGFDALLRRLARERLSVQRLSLHAATRSITMRGELVLLSDMAMKDAALDGRLAKAKADKAAISSAQATLAASMADKKVDLDALAARERALASEFDETVGLGHGAYAALLKIYRRKIKRSKAGGGADAGAGEDDLDDLDDIGDDDDDDEEEETCPDGCDKAMYARVLALRERRLNVQDAVQEVNAAIDEIRKGSDRQTQRERQVDRDLTAIGTEMVSFQREKQGKLNGLDTFAVVQLSQVTAGLQPESASIGHMPVLGAPATPDMPAGPVGSLPSTVDHAVLFTRSALRRLRARISELEVENARLVAGLKSLKSEERRLAADKAGLEADITEVREACNALQILKFGKTIDLELLDRSTGLSADALGKVQADIAEAEARHEAEIASVRARMAGLQEHLTAATHAHTAVLTRIATLTARHAALEGELSGRVDKGLTAVALYATLGTSMATALAAPGGTTSLAAMAPALSRAGVRLDQAVKGQVRGTSSDRKEDSSMSASPSASELNSTAAVVAGLTLSGRHGPAGKGPVVVDEDAAALQEEAEKVRLEALVERQGREVAALRAHVALLKGKGSYSKGMTMIASMTASGSDAQLRSLSPPAAAGKVMHGTGGRTSTVTLLPPASLSMSAAPVKAMPRIPALPPKLRTTVKK